MIPGLKPFQLGTKSLFLHEDHRWVLPLLWQAQQDGRLPTPVKIILFDRHPDAATPENLAVLHQARQAGLTLQSILQICENTISPHDDDWIVAGIHLGLIESVVIFGVDDRTGELPKRLDNGLILGRYDLPGKLLAPGEDLADLSRTTRLRNFWDALDWDPTLPGFRPGAPPILLDIDLDCFAYAYRERVLPWDAAIFENEFAVDYSGTGWTGQRFFDHLVQRAGLITVCREAGCCGGEQNADQIWALVAQHLFRNQLAVS
jgi:hypothetical protein